MKAYEMNAITRLNSIDHGDPEEAHSEADEIILSLVSIEVAAAYQALVERCAWWATA